MTEISKKLVDVERYRAAERLLEIAAETDPEYPLAHGLLALIRAEYGDAAAAEAYARRSLELEDFDPTRHHVLAWVLAAQGRFEEARASRARALEQGELWFWQRHMYQAYMARAEGDEARALQAVDSASAVVATRHGRATVDSVRVSEFGLEPRDLQEPSEAIKVMQL